LFDLSNIGEVFELRADMDEVAVLFVKVGEGINVAEHGRGDSPGIEEVASHDASFERAGGVVSVRQGLVVTAPRPVEEDPAGDQPGEGRDKIRDQRRVGQERYLRAEVPRSLQKMHEADHHRNFDQRVTQRQGRRQDQMGVIGAHELPKAGSRGRLWNRESHFTPLFDCFRRPFQRFGALEAGRAKFYAVVVLLHIPYQPEIDVI